MKSYIFVHQGVSDEIEFALALLGYIVIRLPSFGALGPYVCCHPDSLLFPLPDGRLLMHENYYRENRELFDRTGLRFALTDEPVGAEYPQDVLLNALALRDVLYGRLDSVSKTVKAAYNKHVGVKQGYARCSVLALGERAAVTADRGLEKALLSQGASVLMLPPGGIILRAAAPSGFDEKGKKIKPVGDAVRCDGFIGGSGVMLGEDTCGFFGDITAYKHYEQLQSFARSHGVRLVSLGTGPLEDMGGAVIAGLK